MTYSCQCPCGTTHLKVDGEPIVRFFCHCTICQKMYKAPFVDVALFKLDEVELPEDQDISFGRYKRFGAVDRGLCPACNNPILATMGEGEKGYAFVAARNFKTPEALPPAEMHVFYNTRVDDVTDDLPKYKNAISSRYAFIKRMIGGGREKAANT